jgi:hypothetical protein
MLTVPPKDMDPLPAFDATCFVPLSPEEISESCESLKVQGGQDPSGITPDVVKLCAKNRTFCEALAELANQQQGRAEVCAHYWKRRCKR